MKIPTRNKTIPSTICIAMNAYSNIISRPRNILIGYKISFSGLIRINIKFNSSKTIYTGNSILVGKYDVFI